MRPDRPAIAIGVLLSVVLVSLGAATLAPAQTLVEAARLAAEALARYGPPLKVYTIDDLPADARRPPTLAPPTPDVEAARLDAALARERMLLELLQARPPGPSYREAGPKRDRRDDRTDRIRPQPGGIPLALAYATPYVPFVGSRGTGSGRRGSRPSGRVAGGRTRGRGQPVESAGNNQNGHPFTPPRPDAGRLNRNGYAESSRPFDYIAPGLPAPGAQRGEVAPP